MADRDENPGESAEPATAEHDAEALPPPPAPPPPPHTGPYPRMLHTQMMTPRAPLAPGAGMRVFPLPLHLVSQSPAQWAADPSGQHQWRWWSGVAWTAHVADDGKISVDRLR